MTKPTQIRSVAQMNRYLNMLIYGIPGLGKTRFLGSSPNCLVLECGKSETDTCAAAGQDVDVWEVHTRAALTEAYEYLRHEGHQDYEWVWIDGLSPLEGRLMKEQLKLEHARNSNRSELVPSQPDYLTVQSIIDQFVGWFVDLPMNVGFTAHVMIESTKEFDTDGDEVETLMMMPQIQGGHGKLSQKVCAMMNVVGYLDTLEVDGEKTRAMLVRGDGRHIAKDRFNTLGNSRGWLVIPPDKPMIPLIQSKVADAIRKGPSKPVVKKTAKKAVKATKKSASPRKAAGLRR